MSWRTIVISKRCKLDLSMGYMVVRGEDTKRIFIDEIAVLIIENPAVSLTGCLLSQLAKNKTRIVFCDEKFSPYGELQPYAGCHDSSGKIRTQIAWGENQKKFIWTEIVEEKIRNQSKLLKVLGHEKESEMLKEYISQVCFDDETNREGHAAKVYFNVLFGKDFARTLDTPSNAALNYGYSLLLSAFNREVALCGYLSQLGLHHHNVDNPYNLSCDLMEPFRIAVDNEVVLMKAQKFEKEEKHRLLELLHKPVIINKTEQTFLNAIKIYTKSVFDAINDCDVSKITFAQVI